ncbi:ABC transporter substrate-binding protein [Aerococcaceae bacterium NML190938]|nr:ABC transporter substrate-binding protein [Aerococcaceae bacterium NML190938]MCW6681156.1 ABC transporter substrate-binding protein [Aerococcaceae bacterium NML130460]
MKKFMNLCIICLAVLLVSAPSLHANQRNIKVAIVQLVSHPSLDAITTGIKEGLSQGGYEEGKNLTLDFQNAEGDMSLLPNIAELVVSKKPDIIFAITTPVAQSLQQATQDIPIILAGITDPVAAKLVSSLEKTESNITGVSDAAPLEEQFKLIAQLTPNVKTIGMIYTSSEDNSKAEVDKAAKFAEAAGMTVIVETIASTADMSLVAENLVGKVDAIFVPTDNTVASSADTLLDIADQSGVPIYPTFEDMVKRGGLASVAIDQVGIGRQSAQMAVEIFNGATPQTLPIQFATKVRKVFNAQTASHLDIRLPQALTEQLIDVSGE